MSRILEALRRIEADGREEPEAAPDPQTSDSPREEASVPQPEDGAADDVPSGSPDLFADSPAETDEAAPPYPPETQAVYSLETARALQEDGRANAEPNPRFARFADRVSKVFPAGRPAVLMVTSPGAGEGKTRVTAGLAEAFAARTTGEVLAVDGDF
jgi:Mrp family chromosome partitioning ATPase